MKHALLLGAAGLILSCGAPTASPDTDAATGPAPADRRVKRCGELMPKLMGDWIDAESEPGAVIHERWKPTGNGTYSGIGFVMADKDTVFIEHLWVASDRMGAIAYNVRVPSQDAGAPVAFSLTECAGDSMVFENPMHDFPRRIAYALQHDGTWYATVSGPGKDGSPRTLSYRFKPAP